MHRWSRAPNEPTAPRGGSRAWGARARIKPIARRAEGTHRAGQPRVRGTNPLPVTGKEAIGVGRNAAVARNGAIARSGRAPGHTPRLEWGDGPDPLDCERVARSRS